jgi:hypothetical protein
MPSNKEEDIEKLGCDDEWMEQQVDVVMWVRDPRRYMREVVGDHCIAAWIHW